LYHTELIHCWPDSQILVESVHGLGRITYHPMAQAQIVGYQICPNLTADLPEIVNIKYSYEINKFSDFKSIEGSFK